MSVEFLSEDYIVKANEFIRLNDSQLVALLGDLRTILADGGLTRTAIKWMADLFVPCDRFCSVATEGWLIPDKAPLMPVIALLPGIDELRRFYRDNDIPDQVLFDTLFDVGRNMDECYGRNGRYVIEDQVFGWLVRHFTARLFHLGMLQFEAIRFQEETALLKKGDCVINTHIPAAAKLPHAAAVRSYKLAAALFRKLMPDVEFKGFICESWMLSPQLKLLLDSSSNLVKFADDYVLYGVHSDDTFYSYIYIEKPGDLNSLAEKTTLQRALKAHLLSGGRVEAGRGFMPIEKYA